MRRRTFLSVVPLVVPAVVIARDLAPTMKEGLVYRGYRLHWTGYIGSQERDTWIGKWLAKPLEFREGLTDPSERGYRPYICAMTDGWVGRYNPWDSFPMSYWSERSISSFSLEEDRERVKKETFLALVAFIARGE